MREIDAKKIQKEREEQSITEKLEGGEVDLSEYVGLEKARFERFSVETIITKLTLGNKPNLTELVCYNNQLTTIDLSKCPNLIGLNFSVNQLTSIDFLKQLPYPEKLTVLKLATPMLRKDWSIYRLLLKKAVLTVPPNSPTKK